MDRIFAHNSGLKLGNQLNVQMVEKESLTKFAPFPIIEQGGKQILRATYSTKAQLQSVESKCFSVNRSAKSVKSFLETFLIWLQKPPEKNHIYLDPWLLLAPKCLIYYTQSIWSAQSIFTKWVGALLPWRRGASLKTSKILRQRRGVPSY